MIYLSHLLPDDDMRRLLMQTPLGIESIEFSIGYCLDTYEKTLADYQARLARLSHTGLSIHGPFLDLNPASNDTLIREATKKRFHQAYQAARQLGAKKIIFHTCFVPQINYLEGWANLAIPFWRDFLQDKDESIKIHLENVFDPTYTEIARIVQQVDHPAFSICLDLGHANYSSSLPLTEWISNLGPLIGHIHIHDNNGIDDQHLALGEGTIPWEEVLPALQKHCPHVDYTIENLTAEAVIKTFCKLI